MPSHDQWLGMIFRAAQALIRLRHESLIVRDVGLRKPNAVGPVSTGPTKEKVRVSS
jgi:hypothetical protein